LGDFQQLRRDLSAARALRATLDNALHAARENLRQLDAQVALARRAARDDDSLQTLLAQRQRLAAEVEATKRRYLEVLDHSRSLLQQLAEQATPQEQVTSLDDAFPFLLFPVRLETRFMQVEAHNPRRHQLWIRVYPDDINVDTHEPQLTESEAAALLDYWIEVWKAAGDGERELAAWRALTGGFGSHRAAWMTHQYPPVNAADAPSSPVEESAELAVLPELPALDTKLDSWSRPPRAQLLPDRFVFMGWQAGVKVFEVVGKPVSESLVVGPAPTPLDETDLIEQIGAEIRLQAGMQWLADFDQAVQVGMGIKIDLTASQAKAGFDRLIVLGLRLSADEEESRAQLERLFESHHYSNEGISLLPQGIATNNTESSGAGYSSFDLGEETSFAIEAGDELFTNAEDWTLQADGQLLAQWLGIDSAIFKHVQYGDGYDQRDARAMNTALWPATLGYFMEEMMYPVFSSGDVSKTREFFIEYVRGRGIIPSIRKGVQPYGILPASVLSRWKYPGGGDLDAYAFYNRLHTVLMRIDQDWGTLADSVSYAGKEGDPYQILLDILGLHASSVQFYSRTAVGDDYLSNYLNFAGYESVSISWVGQLLRLGTEILADLGYSFEVLPAIWEKTFFTDQTELDGPVVDDLPLSETDPIRAYTSDGTNYIRWLLDSDLDTITDEDFGDGRTVPQALLYLLLRHAMLLSYWDTTVSIQTPSLAAAKTEKELLYVSTAETWNGKLEYLHSTNESVTGSPDLTLGAWLSTVDLGSIAEAAALAEVKEALGLLADRPTAALERAFTEHLDLCSYRLDAWQLGLIHQRLEALRRISSTTGEVVWRKGIFLGAFGWLENLRPSTRTLEEVAPDEVPEEFQRSGGPPLMRDSANAGYIHAPSLNHAVTAAVLRNAYLTHAGEENAESFAVNLSSERVRRGLAIIEGVRHGQELSELLGYQLERALHDRSSEVADGLDQYIYPLRQKFPLYEDQATSADDDGKNSSSQARNVVNGVALLEHIRDTGNESYPWGTDLDAADATVAAIIDEEVSRMADTLDAVADLAMAEGVYQVVRGNYDRAGAMLKAVSEGGNPPIPEIVQTERSGHVLTQRVALQYKARELGYVLTDADVPCGGVLGATPRARAEYGLNNWLADVLPPLDMVKFTAKVSSATGAVSEAGPYSLFELGLQPIDVIFTLAGRPAEQFEMLDAVIAYFLRRELNLEDAAGVAPEYQERHASYSSDVVTIFELAALATHLHQLVAGSRYLAADDFVLPNEESEDGTGELVDLDELAERARMLRAELDAAQVALDLAIPPFEVELLPTEGEFTALRDALYQLSLFGLPDALPRSAFDVCETARGTLLAQATSLSATIASAKTEYDDLVPTADDSEDDWTEKWIAASRKLFGGGFRLIPGFRYGNPDELQNAHDLAVDPAFVGESSSPLPLDDWLHGVARVRSKLYHLELATLLAEQFGRQGVELVPFQLPYSAASKWLGHAIPADYVWAGDVLLVSVQLAAGFDAGSLQAGLVLDDWTEVVPSEEETTGMTFHFDRPNSEPANVLILAVTPEITGSWSWDDLVDTLIETLDLARKRAVEPEQVDGSNYAQLLPATLMAVTRYLTTISTNLLRNVSTDSILNQSIR
jgi:hypothetical protein